MLTELCTAAYSNFFDKVIVPVDDEPSPQSTLAQSGITSTTDTATKASTPQLPLEWKMLLSEAPTVTSARRAQLQHLTESREAFDAHVTESVYGLTAQHVVDRMTKFVEVALSADAPSK